ncbi:hypothetical protein H0N96_02775 [Candidatus Micrarchaeota archaeon]|nr:hypothetical protein [Candidatus Micrarchaeota archaeon]
MNIPNPYAWKNYKYYAVIPLLLLVAAAFFIPRIPQGIDLKGGLLLTVYSDQAIDVNAVKAAVARVALEADVRSFSNPSGHGIEVELPVNENLDVAGQSVTKIKGLDASLVNAEVQLSYLEQNPGNATVQEISAVRQEVETLRAQIFDETRKVFSLTGDNRAVSSDPHVAATDAEASLDKARSAYTDSIIAAINSVVKVKTHSFKEIGSSLSKFFFSKIQEILLVSFILSAIIVFIIFRSLVPSIAVLFGAFADIAITMGVMGFLGIPLSLASFSALLMLIGFSLDTDILLTARVLKRREENARARAFDAMKVGAMMNLTTIAAFGVLAAIGYWLQIPVYFQLGVVAVIGGGVVDFIATWLTNAPLLLWYVERKEKRGQTD